jgi:hypothetical protein
VAQWVGHLVLAPEVKAEAAAEVGTQGATAEQGGGAATLAGDPLVRANLWARRLWTGLRRSTATSSSGPRRYAGILIPRTSTSTTTVPAGPFCAHLRAAGSQAGLSAIPCPYASGAMQDAASELPRKPLPRSWVNTNCGKLAIASRAVSIG